MPRRETCESLATAITDAIYAFGDENRNLSQAQIEHDVDQLGTSLHSFGAELVTEMVDAMRQPDEGDGDEQEGFETVVYDWPTDNGPCCVCGRPASYRRVLGEGFELCPIHAAEAAADGETILRIKESQ